MSSSSSDSIAFNGSSSDLARQLYYRAKANETVNQLSLTSIPPRLQSRLDSLQLDWDLLPGIAQRALLWDSGYAVSPSNDAIQIWTLGDHDMSTVALTPDEYVAAGCIFSNCTEPDNTTIHVNNQCNGAQMNKVAKCVVQEFDDDISYNTAMWATGGSSSMIPKPRVAKHDWTVSEEDDAHYVVMAVHTLESGDDEPASSDCPSGYGSVVFPCQTTANFTSNLEKNTVKGSAWVSNWLIEDYPEAKVADSSGFDKLLLIPIILGAVVVVSLIGVGFYCNKKRKQRVRKEFEESTAEVGQTPYRAPTPGDEKFDQRDTNARPTLVVSEDLVMSTYAGADQTIQFPVGYGDYVTGSNTTLKILLTSEFLDGKRIPQENVVFEKALSKGASGEVWICEYAGQKVAVKRLLQAKEAKAEDVHEFAEEIELNASLEHPNVGAFIGVAWSSLNNLSMVLEYFPLGDLQRYLKKNADLLSWARDKIHMAVGVASALEYLHTRSPPIIHRDLKSKNILLTRQLETKVIDFGVSRGRLDNTMTAGVGTPFWTAPEILEGKRYSEQADIYSFGVVLSELDTCKIPFHDCISSNGKKQKPFHILKEVMAGILRPSFSEDCPPRIRRIGVACCQHDPARRPTAAQLVTVLQGE